MIAIRTLILVCLFYLFMTTLATPNTCDPCRCCVGGCNTITNYTCDQLGCVEGYWGDTCQQPCLDSRCKTCERSSGAVCTTCTAGYFLIEEEGGSTCSGVCIDRCKTCTTHANNCTECKAGYANDEYTSSCRRRCPSTCFNCSSSGDMCYSCRPGYFNPLFLCSGICSQGCETCDIPYLCTTCKRFFYGPTCSYKCPDNCVKCDDPRTCTECKAGYYGRVCEKTCSRGCIVNCDILNGYCPSCWKGFMAPKCDMCAPGNYGYSCNQTCAFCQGGSCHHITGECFSGCSLPHLRGPHCDQCIDGYFGPFCSEHCPINCLYSICHGQTGSCVNGCSENYTGEYCTEFVGNTTDRHIKMVATTKLQKSAKSSYAPPKLLVAISHNRSVSTSFQNHGYTDLTKQALNKGQQPFETLTYVLAALLALALAVIAVMTTFLARRNALKLLFKNTPETKNECITRDQQLVREEGVTTTVDKQGICATYANTAFQSTYEKLEITSNDTGHNYEPISVPRGVKTR